MKKQFKLLVSPQFLPIRKLYQYCTPQVVCSHLLISSLNIFTANLISFLPPFVCLVYLWLSPYLWLTSVKDKIYGLASGLIAQAMIILEPLKRKHVSALLKVQLRKYVYI